MESGTHRLSRRAASHAESWLPGRPGSRVAGNRGGERLKRGGGRGLAKWTLIVHRGSRLCRPLDPEQERGSECRQRPSSDLRRSPAPANGRPSRATRLLASESTPRGDILALESVHRSRWVACRRGSAAPPTMVLEENVRVIGSWWRLAVGPPGGASGVARAGARRKQRQ